MSKESRRRSRLAEWEQMTDLPETPAPRDYTDTVFEVTQGRFDYFKTALVGLLLFYRSFGRSRQAAIVQRELDYDKELGDPKGKWAIENGQEAPQKPPVNWSGW